MGSATFLRPELDEAQSLNRELRRMTLIRFGSCGFAKDDDFQIRAYWAEREADIDPAVGSLLPDLIAQMHAGQIEGVSARFLAALRTGVVLVVENSAFSDGGFWVLLRGESLGIWEHGRKVHALLSQDDG